MIGIFIEVYNYNEKPHSPIQPKHSHYQEDKTTKIYWKIYVSGTDC